jgi:S1-C subfamily serine protease
MANCQRCGSVNAHRENDREYCSGCGNDLGSAHTAELTGIPVLGLMPGCHAERAGVKVGDLLLKVNGLPINSMEDYVAAVALKKHSQTVVVLRNGIMIDFEMARGAPSPEGQSN